MNKMETISEEELKKAEVEGRGFYIGHIKTNSQIGHLFKDFKKGYKTYCGIKINDFVEKIQEINCRKCLKIK